MVDYREILRLKNLGYSQTDIAASVHSSRNTIQEVLSIASALQIQWPLDEDVTNRVLDVNTDGLEHSARSFRADLPLV